MANETTLITLLSILVLGLIIPELFKKFRLPFITLIIFGGSLFGPFGFNYVHPDETISFFGFLGMTFLMLMAGIETDLYRIKQSKSKIFLMALISGTIPFIVGFSVVSYFGYPLETSILIGIIFISSSIAIITPSLRQGKLLNRENTQLVLATVLILDVVSLLLLGIFFQEASKITNLPLPIYFIVLLLSIIVLMKFVPKISEYALRDRFSKDIGYERKLRFVLAIIIGIIAFFSIIGIHPILGSFLVGLSLSSIIMQDKTGIIYAKLHTLGYGLFVPVFFFIVGMDLDLKLLKEIDFDNLLMVSIILGSIISKILSGYFAGRAVSLPVKESLVFGSISITQLTTTLAVTYTASSLNLIDPILTTSIILLAIITTFLGPLAASFVKIKYFKKY